MIALVRVDDRLLHCQVLSAWIPYTNAELIVVASDDAERVGFRTAVETACGFEGVRVVVETIDDAARDGGSWSVSGPRVVFIVSCLKDAMRLYERGLRFDSINIGNVHHKDDARVVAQSVVLDKEDDAIIEAFVALGVKIDIRDVPSRPAVPYERRSSPR